MGIRGLAVIPVCALLSSNALAQTATTGALYGVITDETGAPLAGVTVIVSSGGTAPQTALTEGNGSYKVTDLPPGEYTVMFYFADTAIERKVPVGVQKVTPL